MRRVCFIAFCILLVMVTFAPIRSYAIESNSLAETPSSGLDDWSSQYNQEQSCESLLGDPADENSVAWLLNKILTYTTIVGMILVVVLSSIDFLKVIAKGDDEAMAKAGKKLGLRLVFAALLFFVPTLTAVILDIFGLTADCGIVQQ